MVSALFPPEPQRYQRLVLKKMFKKFLQKRALDELIILVSPVLPKKVGIMWGTCGDFGFLKTLSGGKLFHLRTKITALPPYCFTAENLRIDSGGLLAPEAFAAPINEARFILSLIRIISHREASAITAFRRVYERKSKIFRIVLELRIR